MKKDNQTLFAIYKKEIHLGNKYGIDEEEAIKAYLLSSYTIQIPDITIEEVIKLHSVDDYTAIEAIASVHYFHSKSLKEKVTYV